MSRVGDGATLPVAQVGVVSPESTPVTAAAATATASAGVTPAGTPVATATATATATAGGATATATAGAGVAGQPAVAGQADVFTTNPQAQYAARCLPPPPPPPPPCPPKTDSSAAKAINELDQKKGPITGEDMARAIEKGTKDPDNRAAGQEFKQFKDWSTKNWDRLTPEGKEVFRAYEKTAQAAQAKGQTGIPQGEYDKMLKEFKGICARDNSASAAIEGLNQKKGPISGEDLSKAIEKGTRDPDNQAAGKEFKQFKDWATKNWDRLTPEGKEVFRAYEKTAQAAQAKGQTGIPQGEYDKMLKELKGICRRDDSASAAIEDLNGKKAPISGEDLSKAIEKGTKDPDNQAAGKEFKQFKDWATKNWDKLSPEAKEVFRTYENTAKAARANGQTGIKQGEYDKMLKEFKSICARDDSASAAIEDLKGKKAPISGEDLSKAIESGTKDTDAQAAGKEFKQFKDWATKNWDKLSPEAKEVFRAYEKTAQAAQAQGQTGIPQGEYDKMLKEFKSICARDDSASAAIENLNQAKGPISGEQMQQAIEKGAGDADGQAAGKEYEQFAAWAKANPDKLSPEAKEVLKIYEQHANAAKAQGQTGITQSDWNSMMNEMKAVSAPDASAKQAIDELTKGQGKISGEDMARAIEKGTSDLDGQAAKKEFDQFAQWAAKNPDRLSPEAKQVMEIYKKYADGARASGGSISAEDYQKMLGEMKNVHTYQDATMGSALDQLNHTSGPVSGNQMTTAILNGTRDQDGQAAGTELQDVLKWARENASRLSPEAKQALTIYAKYAMAAILRGETGIPQAEWDKMAKELKAVGQQPPRFVAA